MKYEISNMGWSLQIEALAKACHSRLDRESSIIKLQIKGGR